MPAERPTRQSPPVTAKTSHPDTQGTPPHPSNKQYCIWGGGGDGVDVFLDWGQVQYALHEEMQQQQIVSEDPELLPEEKQVNLTAVKADDCFRVHSEVASVTRRILALDAATLERTREVDGEIVAVTASIPVEHVSIVADGRENTDWQTMLPRTC